jgi:hypothetical protein
MWVSTGQLLRGSSTNRGTNWNWSPYTNGLPVYIGVSALAVNNVDGNLYVGISGGRGLYRSTCFKEAGRRKAAWKGYASCPVFLHIFPKCGVDPNVQSSRICYISENGENREENETHNHFSYHAAEMRLDHRTKSGPGAGPSSRASVSASLQRRA